MYFNNLNCNIEKQDVPDIIHDAIPVHKGQRINFGPDFPPLDVFEMMGTFKDKLLYGLLESMNDRYLKKKTGIALT